MTDPVADASLSTASGQRLVSIVLTTLNAGRYLQEALNSCLNQTHGNIELIVVDGGSIDGTLDILASYDDPRMRVIHQIDNDGKLPGAINLGLEQARGEYLTWMQADSIYDLHAIETMVAALEQYPEIGQVYADFYEIDVDGNVVQMHKTREPEEFLHVLGDPAGVCFLIRQSVRAAVGPHDVTAYPSQDYDYRMRIALQFLSLHIHEPLYYWRYHGSSLTGQFGWVALAKRDVAIRLKLGLDTPEQARHRSGEIDMAYAFECYQKGKHGQVLRPLLSGFRQNPGKWTRNRGVWVIAGISLWQGLASRQK